MNRNGKRFNRLGMALIVLWMSGVFAGSVHADITWQRKSSSTGDMPVPNDGKQQTCCLILDVDKDGQWNHVTITAVDNKMSIVLNGEQIIDMDLNRWTQPHKNPDPDGSKNKFNTALKDFKREGHIGFQDHGANVWFRNVRIKPL
ncbi:MAG: hypothetical protein A2Z25_05830 [Planctomycetes bacterium RBG_16_55_9]|nr:MAG: hypothetical protein A2Z25_05830 [Planctomycetes bacterium RBG_16_55_9]